jgi:predicted lipoprotein with Yx(FWY)xxD motif
MTAKKAKITALTGAAAALLALSAACTSAEGSSNAAQVPAATGDAVSAQPTPLGTILVDGKGHTVYEFANDTTTTSTCTGACAADWPPVPAPAQLPASLPGVSGALGTTARPDGSQQLTVSGHPLYTFSGDSAPGQTSGQGINLNGGVWTVVSPSGAPDTSPAGATTPDSHPGY